jgi:hypothetical protein
VLKENAERREGQTINSSAIHLMLPTIPSHVIPQNKDLEKDDNTEIVINGIAFSHCGGYQLLITGKYETKRIYLSRRALFDVTKNQILRGHYNRTI